MSIYLGRICNVNVLIFNNLTFVSFSFTLNLLLYYNTQVEKINVTIVNNLDKLLFMFNVSY